MDYLSIASFFLKNTCILSSNLGSCVHHDSWLIVSHINHIIFLVYYKIERKDFQYHEHGYKYICFFNFYHKCGDRINIQLKKPEVSDSISISIELHLF